LNEPGAVATTQVTLYQPFGDVAPSVAVPQGETAAEGVSVNIPGIVIADATPGANLSVALSDSGGLLSANTNATGGGGTITGEGTHDLAIVGSLTQINADLSTLSYDDVSAPGVDNLVISANDGLGGVTDSVVAIDVACFCRGTRIRTPDGEVAVETLKPGDLVTTTDGVAKPVTWLGKQTISTRFADPLRVWPVRVKAGALGENIPSRDLVLSPDHALFIDGALYQAAALVNGASIAREPTAPRTFVYYHVELEDHSLIYAENAPAETFVDNVERLAFDNWAEHEALYPEGKPITEMHYARAKGSRQVPERVRAALAERARLLYPAAAQAA
jgi:hypothetical protein